MSTFLELCQRRQPPHKNIAALLAVGYPADDTIRAKVRKPFAGVVRFV